MEQEQSKSEALWAKLSELTGKEMDSSKSAFLAFTVVEGGDDVEVAFEERGDNIVMRSVVAQPDAELDAAMMKRILDAQFGMIKTPFYTIGFDEFDGYQMVLSMPVEELPLGDLELLLQRFLADAYQWRDLLK